MRIVSSPGDLQPFHNGIGVPTMGALHAGHRALIEYAVERRETLSRAEMSDPARNRERRAVVVTTFVNPTQFGPGEDFNRYPRTFDADVAVCEAAGVDVVFAPEVETIYPGDSQQRGPDFPLPDVATTPGLEDRHRPGHFAGVCRVVHRLFDLVRPAEAVFGKKDYQQLLVIRAMVEMLGLGVAIHARPTVREADGLALSSRNVYLSPTQRQRALGLSRALAAAAQTSSPRDAEAAMRSVLLAHQVAIDYAVVRDAETLMPIDDFSRPARALIAGRVGAVRLIDNGPCSDPEQWDRQIEEDVRSG